MRWVDDGVFAECWDVGECGSAGYRVWLPRRYLIEALECFDLITKPTDGRRGPFEYPGRCDLGNKVVVHVVCFLLRVCRADADADADAIRGCDDIIDVETADVKKVDEIQIRRDRR